MAARIIENERKEEKKELIIMQTRDGRTRRLHARNC
jgi:hypothetical protein